MAYPKRCLAIPIPVRKERMEANFNIFDFQRSAADMAAIKHWIGLAQGGKGY